MMDKTLHFVLTLFILGASLSLSNAQSKRDLMLEGDFMYETENYTEAETNYQKAVNKEPDFQSHFNLGVSQEKQVPQGNTQTAQQAMGEPQENPNIQNALSNYQSALSFAEDDTERSMALYNMGNTIIADKSNVSIEKLEEAVENYKAAIRYDKNNDPARHNLALTQIMLDRARQQQQQQQQQQQENQDSESEENQEQEQQEQQEQEQEQEEQSEEQNEQQEQKTKEEQQREMEAQKQKVDEKEIENILKMVEQEDKDVQQKMRKQTKSTETNKKKKW